jgi:hypothetical protein
MATARRVAQAGELPLEANRPSRSSFLLSVETEQRPTAPFVDKQNWQSALLLLVLCGHLPGTL